MNWFKKAPNPKDSNKEQKQEQLTEQEMLAELGWSLTDFIGQLLKSEEVPEVSKVEVEKKTIVIEDRRLAINSRIEEVSPNHMHAHVMSHLPFKNAPNGKETLDACVMGMGETIDDTIANAGVIWLQTVGAPILSLLFGKPILESDHFTEKDKWGVPGFHGFVGPMMCRGDGANEIDLEAVARLPLFQYDKYPIDDRLHIAKVVLSAINGEWQRCVEIDGHKTVHQDNQSFGLKPPKGVIICVRFGVFFNDSFERN